MSQFFERAPNTPKHEVQEKRKSLWMKVKFVTGAFLGTIIVTLLSNAFGEPWAGVAHRDRQGNLVTEPDWSLALTISLNLGGVVAGFGDLREVELLVEAGFTPVEAIKIASFNGAMFLGEDARIGSIAV